MSNCTSSSLLTSENALVSSHAFSYLEVLALKNNLESLFFLIINEEWHNALDLVISSVLLFNLYIFPALSPSNE